MGQILVDERHPIAVVTISNERKRNAWDEAMRETLVKEIGRLGADPRCIAIVITGAGTAAFCAGADIDEVRLAPGGEAGATMNDYRSLFDALWDCPKPVVAAVRGVSAGSGFQFALLCDAIVTHPEARLGQPEIRSGLASVTGSWLIAQAVGLMRMKDLVLSGRLLSGQEADSWGLVSRLVPADEVLAVATGLAEELGALRPVSFSVTKRAIAGMYRDGFRASFRAAAELHNEIDVSKAVVARGGRPVTAESFES